MNGKLICDRTGIKISWESGDYSVNVSGAIAYSYEKKYWFPYSHYKAKSIPVN